MTLELWPIRSSVNIQFKSFEMQLLQILSEKFVVRYSLKIVFSEKLIEKYTFIHRHWNVMIHV